MRIAILTNAYPPLSRGGAGRIADIQARWLAGQGHEVRVFTVEPFVADTQSAIQVQAFPPRTTTKFADLGSKPAWARLIFHLEDVAPNLAAVDAIRAWKPDALITHNLTGCGWGTAKMLKSSGLRWLHVLHDVQMFEPSGQRLYGERHYGLKKRWRRFWARKRQRALGKPDVVASPTRWLLEQHKAYGLFADADCRVIPNPIENISADAPVDEASTLAAPTDTGDFHVVIYLGRMSYDKGLDLLLEAWCSFEPRPGQLILVGDGPLREMCERASDASVQVVGQLAHDAAMERMAQADLVVLPSRVMENQPTVLLEAVALGKRVVAADVGGVRETLEGYGAIVTPDDSVALARGMQEAFGREPDEAVRKKIFARHAEDAAMARLMECLQA